MPHNVRSCAVSKAQRAPQRTHCAMTAFTGSGHATAVRCLRVPSRPAQRVRALDGLHRSAAAPWAFSLLSRGVATTPRREIRLRRRWINRDVPYPNRVARPQRIRLPANGRASSRAGAAMKAGGAAPIYRRSAHAAVRLRRSPIEQA